MKFLDSVYGLLPNQYNEIFKNKVNLDRVYEIRIRNESPVVINYNGKFYYLSKNGITEQKQDALVAGEKLAGEILVRASEFSLYAVNSQICDGYLTISGGIRIGISGEVVTEDERVKTIKHISSVNIRIPHEVPDCAMKAFRSISGNHVRNALIISPPGAGKTTILRDLARLMSEIKPIKNVLIIDERSEIAAAYNGKAQLNVGIHTDIITNCKKQFAFQKAIRSMSPDVIITDEIASEEDIRSIDYAINCGISIIASTHAKDHLDLLNKRGFDDLIKKRIFKRFIVLSSKFGPGTYDGIYDENFSSLYFTT